jgi:hypothetical protein
MTLLDVFNRMQNHEPIDFVAPVPANGDVSLWVYQDNIPYQFKVRPNGTAGWYNLRPIDKKRARIIGEANALDIQKYLAQLASFHVITVYPIDETSWLVFPYNESDASQRGWMKGEPKVMKFVDGRNLRPLDVVVARRLGDMLLYHHHARIDTSSVKKVQRDLDTAVRNVLRFSEVSGGVPSYLANPVKAYLDRQAELERIAGARQIELLEARRRQEALELLQTAHGRIATYLGWAGAELVNWKEVGNDKVSVTYRHEGAEITIPIVDVNTMRCEVAGICLNRTDQKYTLTSIVKVMHQARQLHRHDIPRELWLNEEVEDEEVRRYSEREDN